MKYRKDDIIAWSDQAIIYYSLVYYIYTDGSFYGLLLLPIIGC